MWHRNEKSKKYLNSNTVMKILHTDEIRYTCGWLVGWLLVYAVCMSVWVSMAWVDITNINTCTTHSNINSNATNGDFHVVFFFHSDC